MALKKRSLAYFAEYVYIPQGWRVYFTEGQTPSFGLTILILVYVHS